MPNVIFLAGSSGAVGARIVPLLVRAGHTVHGTTRSPAKVAALAAAGVTPVVVDVFDAAALRMAMLAARPDIVIHQLTDLPPGLDPARMASAGAANARIRDEGTRNLVAGALAAGAGRLIVQSIAWAYAPGPEPHGEDDPLDLDAAEPRATTIRGVVALEHATLESPPLDGVVLRYGQLYGPGTGADARRPGGAPLHVDAAASAAFLALDRGVSGAYNLAENDLFVATGKARRELGFDAGFRLAPEPR